MGGKWTSKKPVSEYYAGRKIAPKWAINMQDYGVLV